ncbi:DUF3261 domain-containing protein [Collimonas sp. NPDC087041]|uniref:DUF3261 domain-containing protein n=1 Tax=Collimonas sp. NPDC087041 TaxID=3363960 RepID=UPI00380C57B1
MQLGRAAHRRLVTLLAALALAGCAAAPPAPPPARLGLKLAPATLGSSVSLQQHLTVERNGRTDQLDAALEIDPQQFNMVGLAFGQRVLTLHYDGVTLQSWRHPMLPSQVRAEDVLEDTQLTLWPVDAIRQALPAGWEIRQQGLRRTLSLQGEPVMVIDYSTALPWGGKIELTNLRYHYHLTIESVSDDVAEPTTAP